MNTDKTATATAAEQAKASGFKSLAQVAKMINVTTQCLRNWHKYEKTRFKVVLLGCKEHLKTI